MNYYQHHIGDFIRDTARLSDAQCMAYLRLIWMYYETEDPIDCDVDALAFKIGASASDVRQILKHFFFEHDGRWHNSRCDREILAFRKKSEKAKDSANARWENAKAMRTHGDASPDANACERMQTHENAGSVAVKTGSKNAQNMRTHSGRNANERVSDANQEPVTNISTTDVVDNPSDQKTSGPKRKAHGSEEDQKAARWMFERVQRLNATAKEPNWNGWANDVRLMREIDGRTHAEICEQFDWANKDSFWCSNILSPAKLRDKWDTLATQRGTRRPAGRTPATNDFSKIDYGETRDI